ncbi:MAG TPA: diaminopropionate ammonia-lyase [Candidatus Acidoferrales bacterium]|nr:diaminopropionate ammonia-lyase [Candidatus Acidoferrales bacterium]
MRRSLRPRLNSVADQQHSRIYRRGILGAHLQPSLICDEGPPGPIQTAIALHQRFAGYRSTRLIGAPSLAQRLGVGSVWVKDESERLGLPSYKILGASWAVYRALVQHLGPPPPWGEFSELRSWVANHRAITLVGATDGNHGRAVAHMARLLGVSARIVVPAQIVAPSVAAIKAEGAEVAVVDGSYDDAVSTSAEDLGEQDLLVSDTSWPGYEQVPCWVAAGYQTMFDEVDQQLEALHVGLPDAVVVQVGVGTLASAAATHYQTNKSDARVITVEPVRAACLLESLVAGHEVAVPGPHESVMAGLNCGKPSLIAWRVLRDAVDVAVSVTDDLAREAVLLMAAAGIRSGYSGAAGLAGALRLASQGGLAAAPLHLGEGSVVLLLNTEGIVDQTVGLTRGSR